MKTKKKEFKQKLFVKKSENEKEISVIDNELKDLIVIIKPSNTSKIYEKFE